MDKRTLNWQEKCERYICTIPRTDAQSSKTRQNKSCKNFSGDKKVYLHHVEKLSNLAVLISLHGIPFIIRCTNWFGKCVWSLICLLTCALLSYLCYLFAWEFISQRDVATVSYDYNTSAIPIPKLTICNLNMLKRSTLSGSVFENLTILDDQPLVDVYKISPESEKGFPMFDKSVFKSFAEQHGKVYIERIITDLESQFNRNFENPEEFRWDDLYKVSQHTGYTELKRNIQLTREQLQYHGHKPWDTLITGHLDGRLLDTRDISDYIHPTYGRCFSLNMITNDIGSVISGTLSMILNLEADEYISFLSPSVGAVLSIHDPDEEFTEASAIKVVPGEHSHVTITLEETNRPEPCEKQPGYTIKECRRQCLHRHVQTSCGCSTDFDEIGSTRCLTRKRNHYVCSRFMEILHKSSKLTCVCPTKCRENNFRLSQEKTKWPSHKYMPHLKKRISSFGVNLDSNKIRENLAQVSVTLNTDHVKKIRIAPQITLLNLLVKIGGISALLTGISIITILEILWVLCVSFGRCCRRTMSRMSRHNYVRQSEVETPSTDPQRTTKRPQCHQIESDGVQGANLFQRKDSNILRTRKRLGANRRRSNRSAPRSQLEPDIFITPFPILTSTVRQNKSTSNGEFGVASSNHLISNHRSSEESREYNGNFQGCLPSPVGQRQKGRDGIVPRLNLRDLASDADASVILRPGEKRFDNHFDQSESIEASQRRNVIDSDMKRVFNEIRRHHSDASDLRQFVYQPSRGPHNILTRDNSFLS